MAIKKSEAGKLLAEQDRKDVATLEVFIDEQLDLRYDPAQIHSYVTIDFKTLSSQIDGREVDGRITNQLVKLYEAAKWNVRVIHDQRDDSFIQFS